MGTGVTIKAPDIETVELMRPGDRDYGGPAGLLKAAVNLLDVTGSARITVWADAPPACGLGTSAAISVAMVAALAALGERGMSPGEVATMAQRLETEELGLESGVQDQHASAYGGINLMDIQYPHADVTPVAVPEDVRSELEERLVLVYLGPRQSSDVHLKVIERFRAGDAAVTDALDRLRTLPRLFATALEEGHIAAAGEVLQANWDESLRLHPDVTSQLIEDVHAAARKAGAVACCANGAGGGGSTVVMAATGREVEVRDAVNEVCDRARPARGFGPRILPFSLSAAGVRSWESEP